MATRSSSATASWRSFDPDSTCDLRRRRHRAIIEHVADLAEHLDQADAALVRAVYRDGQRIVDLAALRDENVRSLRRRVRRLVGRVVDAKFQFVVAERGQWTRSRRLVAEHTVLRGASLRETAQRLKLSLHAVRRHHEAVHALFEAARDRSSTNTHAA